MQSEFRYKAWANAELLEALSLVDSEKYTESWKMAVRLVNHTYVVDRIFAAHLMSQEHSFGGTNTIDTPSLEQLTRIVGESDQWYVDYAGRTDAQSLSERLCFTFTDGEKGSMTRKEILTHILVHGAYHRGNVGMLLTSCGVNRPADTFTRFLHLTDPDRRTYR